MCTRSIAIVTFLAFSLSASVVFAQCGCGAATVAPSYTASYVPTTTYYAPETYTSYYAPTTAYYAPETYTSYYSADDRVLRPQRLHFLLHADNRVLYALCYLRASCRSCCGAL